MATMFLESDIEEEYKRMFENDKKIRERNNRFLDKLYCSCEYQAFNEFIEKVVSKYKENENWVRYNEITNAIVEYANSNKFAEFRSKGYLDDCHTNLFIVGKWLIGDDYNNILIQQITEKQLADHNEIILQEAMIALANINVNTITNEQLLKFSKRIVNAHLECQKELIKREK